MKKKLFAMLLTLAMVFTFMPALAFADAEAEGQNEKEASEAAVQTETADDEAGEEVVLHEKTDTVNAESADKAKDTSEKAAAQTSATSGDEEEVPEEAQVTELRFTTSYDYKGYIGSHQMVDRFGHDGEKIEFVYSDGTSAVLIYDQADGVFYLDEESSTNTYYYDCIYSGDIEWDFSDPDQMTFTEGENSIMIMAGGMTSTEPVLVTGAPKAPEVVSLKYTQKAGNDPLESYAGVRYANILNYNWPQPGDTLVLTLDNGNSVKYTYTDGDEDEGSGFLDADGNNLEDTYTDSYWLEFKGDQDAYAAGMNTVSFCLRDEPKYQSSDDVDYDDCVVRCDVEVKGVVSDIWSISYKKAKTINLEQEKGLEDYFDYYEVFTQGDVLTVRYLNGTNKSYTYYEDEEEFINKKGSSNEENWDYLEDELEYYDTQEENPWVKGYYSIFYVYQGVECEAKNAVYVKEIPHEHSLDYYPAEEPYCGDEIPGVREHYHCDICGKDFEDAEGLTEVQESDLEIAPEHDWGEPSALDESYYPAIEIRTCNICGAEETEYAEHEHSLTPDEGREATCLEEGIKDHFRCDICGKAFADENASKELSKEELAIPVKEHSYSEPVYEWSSNNREVRAYAICSECNEEEEETVRTKATVKKKATCVSKGTTVYTATFENEVFTTQTRELENRVINPYAHTWNAGTVTKKASGTATGAKTFTCTACKKTRTEIIPKVTLAKTTIRNTVANSAKKTNDVIWDKVAGATGYEISWRARGASKWATREVGNVVRGATTGLTIGGMYEIRVRPIKAASATNDKVYGPYSATVYRYFHTTGKIRLASNSKGTFTMSWAKNPSATGYQVLYTTNKNGSGAAQNIKTAGASATSITVRDIKVNGKAQALRSGTTYYVQIREIKKVGNITYIGNISCPVAVKVR